MKSKVLILDDDRATLDVLKVAFEIEEMDVLTADCEMEFTACMNTFSPDIVLIDYLLQGSNGGEICHRVKTDEKSTGCPVIMMSAYPRVFESIGNYGCDSFFAKPFDLYELIDKVRELTLKVSGKGKQRRRHANSGVAVRN